MRVRTFAWCLLLLPDPGAIGDEPALDPMVARSLRERLASGSFAQAAAALADMKEAPHSRHGLLIHQTMTRAELRVEAADRRLPELDEERGAIAAELDAARDSTSTSTVRRLTERLAGLDRERGELASQRDFEIRLRALCAEGWRLIAPRLPSASADELAADLGMRLSEERRPGARALWVEMAGAVPSPAVMPVLMELAGGRADSPEIVAAALAALGRRGEKSATPAAVAALSHPDWRVQSEAVEALRRIHSRSAIPFLLDRLEQAEGRQRDDLGFALRSLTGERFVADPRIWRRWWEEHQADFTMPSAPAERHEPADPPGGTSFFGIGSFSKGVVFVLDVSGSMAQPAFSGTDRTRRQSKLEVARAHLKSAIAGLSSDARFDVLLYASTVESCFPGLEPADDEHRRAALEWVDRQTPRNGTDIHAALTEALALAEAEPRGRPGASAIARRPPLLDTIFFLTDGYPTSGLVREPRLLLHEIAAHNRTRRVRIHAVGVGDHDRAFLQALADQNGGIYVAR